MAVRPAQEIFLTPDLLPAGQHVAVLLAEIVFLLVDLLPACQHAAVLLAEKIFLSADGLPAGDLLPRRIVIVFFTGDGSPAGFGGCRRRFLHRRRLHGGRLLFQAKILRDRGRVRLAQLFQEGFLLELGGIAGIGHEGVLDDHGRDLESLAVIEDAVIVPLIPLRVAAVLVVAVADTGAPVGHAAGCHLADHDRCQPPGSIPDRAVEAAVLIIDAGAVGLFALTLSEGIVVQADKNIRTVVLRDLCPGLPVPVVLVLADGRVRTPGHDHPHVRVLEKLRLAVAGDLEIEGLLLHPVIGRALLPAAVPGVQDNDLRARRGLRLRLQQRLPRQDACAGGPGQDHSG